MTRQEQAERARLGLENLRKVVDGIVLAKDQRAMLSAQLNAIADRLALCDALELKLKRLTAQLDELMQLAQAAEAQIAAVMEKKS